MQEGHGTVVPSIPNAAGACELPFPSPDCPPLTTLESACQTTAVSRRRASKKRGKAVIVVVKTWRNQRQNGSLAERVQSQTATHNIVWHMSLEYQSKNDTASE